ncbi:MAG TPA: hypothetical protein VMM83_06330 [Longimicrobiales bacterium]|nr:hypothetical protein [Longimicrobiales bacterium]
MLTWLFVGASLLVVAAGLGARRRVTRLRNGLSDDDIRALERGGRIEVDEPLDLDEAAEEEARFWNESWDEPEPM